MQAGILLETHSRRHCWGKPLFASQGCRPACAENDPLDHFPGASAPKERFPPVPQARSAQVRFMRTLLVSPDLTADDILSAGSIVATPLHGEVAPFRLISALT